jgi:hypothetical protein
MCKRILTIRIAWFTLLLLLACAGCGSRRPEVGRVDGTLTFDGKPLASVMVSFIPVGGGPAAAGSSNHKGEYRLVCLGDAKGALVGEHRVVFTKIVAETPTNPDGDAPADSQQEAYAGAAEGAAGSSLLWGADTGLIVEVKPGANVIHFQLGSDKTPSIKYGD